MNSYFGATFLAGAFFDITFLTFAGLAAVALASAAVITFLLCLLYLYAHC